MNPILSIGITSYKRIKELVRCLNSIQTKYVNDIEIVVSEDQSPLSDEIKETVEKIAEGSQYNIRFTTNHMNLGYDMNLGSIIKKCQGKYIFFMSDDDCIYTDCLDKIIPFLKRAECTIESEASDSGDGYGVLYGSFIYSSNGKKDRFRGKSFTISKGEDSASKYIYDSILFSGLIFRKEYVDVFESDRFKNHNYFQVYLFLQMLYRYGGYYFGFPTIICVGDGENAYGISESSGGNEILANRKSIISNLEFNKTLIKVIKMFDADEGCHVMDSFSKQYSLHSYSGLSIARGNGIRYFKEYWSTLNDLDIKFTPIIKWYYVILLILGEKRSNRIMNFFRKMVKKE